MRTDNKILFTIYLNIFHHKISACNKRKFRLFLCLQKRLRLYKRFCKTVLRLKETYFPHFAQRSGERRRILLERCRIKHLVIVHIHVTSLIYGKFYGKVHNEVGCFTIGSCTFCRNIIRRRESENPSCNADRIITHGCSLYS